MTEHIPFINSFELLGRLTVRGTASAIVLLRTLRCWVINDRPSTVTTLIEGYLADGSSSYRSNRVIDMIGAN